MISDDYDLHSSTGYWVTLLARTMESFFEERLTANGLTMGTWPVLSAIHHGRAKTPAAVAKFIGIDGAAITRHLDRLEKQGLLVRCPNASDRRSINVKLTAKGKRLVPKIAKYSKETNDKFLKGLTTAEVTTLRALIIRMLENSDEPPKQI